MAWLFAFVVLFLSVFVVLAFVLVFRWHTRGRPPACPDGAQRGVYDLVPDEELVILSYPGPGRGGAFLAGPPPSHGLAAPDLMPITTVTNAVGRIDLVVETWPHEHWFSGAPPDPLPSPQVQTCEQDTLTYTKRLPEASQPGIARTVYQQAAVPTVEVRPIYHVTLEAGQSSSVYADPPGAWLRLIAGREGARGSYCLSWCCPDNIRPSRPGSSPPPPRPPPQFPPDDELPTDRPER